MASSPSETRKSDDLSGQSCLFVANLPHRMTNEQLAMALISTFKHFGQILSVKASRDIRGRPFGFVDFADPSGARNALEAAPYIHINFRQVRIEPARCQRKLSIKMEIPSDVSEDKVSSRMKAMRALFLGYVGEDDLKMSVGRGNRGEALVSGILKFTDSTLADCAFEELSKVSKEWAVEWISNEKDNITGIRSSGLVHIVPSKLGNGAFYSVPLYIPNYWSPQPEYYASNHVSMPLIPQYEKRVIAEPPVFEEHVIRPSQSGSPDISREFEEVSLNGNSSVSSNAPERILEATIFVGRLNGQKVNRDLVLEQFNQFGTIRYICLFNKGALSPEGVPLDAYAFVTFKSKTDAREAIKNMNGTVWLGQTVKCEPARVVPPTPSVIQLYHTDAY